MPKWETRETARTTAHREERTLKRMNKLGSKTRANKLMSDASSNDISKPVKKKILSVIFTNPYVLGITIVLGIVFIIYISQTVDNYLDDILMQYNSLTMKPENSKIGFDKKLFYVTVDADGKQTITVGYRSELEKKQAEQAAQDASIGNDANWSGSTLAHNALDFYDTVKYDGKGSTVLTLSNGVKLYSGIPWSDDGNWYKLDFNSISGYLHKNLSSNRNFEFTGVCHTDNNNEVVVSRNGVTCAGIAWLPIFAFCSSDDAGNLSPAWTSSLANKGYGVVILEKEGREYYMPIASGGDNKGHTWPGGLVQTYIGNGTKLNTSTGELTFHSGGNSSDISGISWNNALAHNQKINHSDLLNGWADSLKYNGCSMSSGGHPRISLETTTSTISAISGYEIKGFILHKGE